MTIPKIIHQTWKTNHIPDSLIKLSETWKKHHPDWEYRLWTDEDSRAFVKQQFAYLLPIYDGFEFNIQRADVIRYLILSKLGGLYVDMDFECFTNLEDTFGESSCIFALEPKEHSRSHKLEIMVCNAFMASIPAHPFVNLLVEEIAQPTKTTDDPNHTVMDSTGPYMVTRIYEKHKQDKSVKILGPEVVYPLNKIEVLKILNGEELEPDVQKRLDNAVAVHYWLGTWLKKTS